MKEKKVKKPKGLKKFYVVFCKATRDVVSLLLKTSESADSATAMLNSAVGKEQYASGIVEYIPHSTIKDRYVLFATDPVNLNLALIPPAKILL